MQGESSNDMFWGSVDIGDLEPTPLSGSLEDQVIPPNLEEGGDFDMPVEDFLDLDPFPLEGMPLDGDDWLSTQTLPEGSGNKPGGSPRAGNVSMDSSAVGGSGGASTRPGAYVPTPGALGASGAGGLAVSSGLQQQQQGLPQLQTQLSVGGLNPLGNGASGVAPINPADPIPEPLPQTVVDRLAAVVAGGGTAATNLGRLAGTVSAQLGFRAPGSTAAADSSRSYLGGAAQDPDLLAAEVSLGMGQSGLASGGGGGGGAPTASGLRSAGQTLGRQANSAFEAMATAADVNKGNPALLHNVINHQLGPMPRLLNGLVSGCTVVVPAPSVAAVPPAGSSSRGSGPAQDGTAAATAAAGAAPPAISNKRTKDECGDGDDGRPEKKIALGGGGGGDRSGSSSPTMSPSMAAAAAAAAAAATSGSNDALLGSENGGGASSSPATAAPPASSNLLARPASADFRHGGGEELMALLKAKVGRLFSLSAEYTHVRTGVVPENGSPAARGGGEVGKKQEDGLTNGGGAAAAATTTAVGTTTAGDVKSDVGGGGLRRVLARVKAVRAGHFVVHMMFDVAGSNECRPCDVSVLSWNEAQEGESAFAGGADARVKVEGGGQSGGGFMDTVHGSKPWRTSQHTAFIRVSGHAFQALHGFVNKRTDGNVGEALASFLTWMANYDRVFQDPCTIANKLVATDSGTGEPLPPTLRTSDGSALLAESLAGTPQRKPQSPASSQTVSAAAAGTGVATAEA
ncbi:unnamed protein product [Ectocarpus sp. 12 AP-2014]